MIKKLTIVALGTLLTLSSMANILSDEIVTLKTPELETSLEADAESVGDYLADRLAKDSQYERTNLLKQNDLDPDEYSFLGLDAAKCESKKASSKTSLLWTCEAVFLRN